MSSEADELKINKKRGSSRSSRSSSSPKTTKTLKAGEGTEYNSEEDSLGSSSRSHSARGRKVDPSSKGSIISSASPNATPTPSNISKSSSLRHPKNSENPSGNSHERSCSSSSALDASPGPESLSSSLSSRLSLKSVGRRKSPVQTQFNLPATESSSTAASGTDQIPKDSISALASSSPKTSVRAAGSSGNIRGNLGAAASSSCLNNNSDSCNKNNFNGTGYNSLPQPCSKASLLKKERGASASPPTQRAHFQDSAPSASTSALAQAASSSESTNPVIHLPSTVITEPADPSIPWIPGTSAPISVDRVHSVKITRKILHNWRSACGRTKDRTKDLIRRWKTLPENHPDFEQCPTSPSTSKKKVSSTSNLNSTSPALGKKKLDKSAGKTESASSRPSATTTAPTSTSGPTLAVTLTPALNRKESKVKVPATSTVSLPTSAALAVSVNTPAEPLCNSSAPKSSVSVAAASTSPKSPKKQSQQQKPVENEMPVVGISGKGSSSFGVGDGTIGSGNNLQGSASGGAGRLGSGMMPGIGRPSISINNSLTAVNGRSGAASQDMSGGAAGGPGGQSKSSTGWTVHVWATYVQRDDLEQLECDEPKKPDRDHLSDFQKVKLTHFFRHVLDMNHDDVISAEDFVALNQRIRHYIEWSSECIEFHILKEVHSGFLECFLNQPLDDCSVMYYCNTDKETRHHVNIDEWLDVWGGLLHSARTMESLPLWLQYFPKILFQVFNKSGSGTISREELRAFYTMFLGIDFRVVNESLESIYKAMTDGGRHKITYDLFKLCFANFLLGKYPNGPGQYLFGICSPQTLDCSFPIDYSALNTHPDDMELYDPEKDKSQSNRRSVIV